MARAVKHSTAVESQARPEDSTADSAPRLPAAHQQSATAAGPHQQRRPIREVDPSNNPWKELKRSEFRKAHPSEDTYHHPFVDQIVDLPVLAADEMYTRPLKKARFPSYLDTHGHDVCGPTQGLLYQFLSEKVKPEHFAEARTTLFPETRIVDSRGRVIFENFGHFLTTAWRYERFVAEQDARSSIDPELNGETYSGPLHLLFAAMLGEPGSYENEQAITRAQDKFEKRGVLADLNLRALDDPDFQAGPNRATVAAVHEACVQLYGCLPKEIPAEFRAARFAGSDGSKVVTGEELISALSVLVGRTFSRDSDPRGKMRLGLSVLGVPELVQYFTEHPWPKEWTGEAQPAAALNPDGLRYANLRAIEFSRAADPSEQFRSGTFRPLAPGERSLVVPELEQFLKTRLLTAEEFLERRDTQKAIKQDKPSVSYFYYLDGVTSELYKIRDKLIAEKLVTPEPPTYLATDLDDLKIVDAKGRVIFENVAQVFAEISRYEEYGWAQEKRVSAALKLQTNPHRHHTALTWMEVAYSGDVKNEKPHEERLRTFNHGGILVDAQLRSLNEFDGERGIDDAAALRVLQEAFYLLYGGIPANPREALHERTFCSETAKFSISGVDLLGAAHRHLIATGRSSAEPALVQLLQNAQSELPPASRAQVQASLPLADLEIRKYNPNGNPSKLIVGREFRQAQPSERTIILPELDLLCSRTLPSVEEFRAAYRADPEFKGDPPPYFEKEILSDVFVDVVARLSSEGLLKTDPPQYRTSDLPDLRFCDSKGRVIFENFGHFLEMAARYQNYGLDQQHVIDRERDPGVRFPHHESALERMHTLVSISASDPEVHEKAKELFRTGSLYVDANLSTLNGVSLLAKDEAYRRLYPEKVRRAFTGEVAMEALQEACLQLCGGIPSSLRRALEDHMYMDEGGNMMVPSHALIDRALKYCKARGIADDEKGLVRALANQGNAAAVVVSAAAIAPKEPAKGPTEQDKIVRLAVSQDLSTEVLFFALCSLGMEKENARAHKSFGERIIRARDENWAARQPVEKKLAPLEAVTTLMDASGEAGHTIKYNELFKRRFADLLKQLCYRASGSNISETIEELRDYRSHLAKTKDPQTAKLLDRVLGEVCPELIRLLEAVRDYRDPPTLRRPLLPEQREGVAAAQFFERKLLLFGAGCGKTDTTAGYCEATKAERVFWCTRSGNVPETAKKLREEILARGEKVGELTAEWNHRSLKDFKKFLASHRYVVAGYDANRAMQSNAPEHFAALQEWVKGSTRVLDEAQFLDNYRSGRSKALQALPAQDTIVASATPVQHRFARVATILHLALPEKFPDAPALSRELQNSPKIIRDLLLAHSTMYSIHDIAGYFDPTSGVPLGDQLKGGRPLIPRLTIERRPYPMSLAHARHYVDIATNYPAYAENQGLKHGPLHQIAALRQLMYHPERLGAPPPLALLDAVKEIALPAIEKGEKVLIFGHRRHTLDLFAADPEFQAAGCALLTGDMPAAERAKKLKQFEDEPKLRCVFAQSEAAGTGSDCRSVSHMIFLDLAPLDSQVIQNLGRPIRLLFPGQERFAKAEVKAWFMEASLPKEVLGEVQGQKRLQVLNRGTYYEGVTADRLARVRSYEYYVSRDRGSSGGLARMPFAQVVERLVETGQQLKPALEHEELLVQRQKQIFGVYNNPVKNPWRNDELFGFVRNHLSALNKPVEDLIVVHLAGPECLEIPIYLELGFKPENIYAFEGAGGLRAKVCREKVNYYGCRFVGARVENVLPSLKTPIDIVDIDADGYLTPGLFNMFLKLNLGDTAIILKNTLAARENDEAQALLTSALGKREFLDVALMKLVATHGQHKLSDCSVADTMKVARLTQLTAKSIAVPLARELGVDSTVCADFIGEAFLGSRHTDKFSQVDYVSPGGSRFLSTFGLLSRWDGSVRESEGVQQMRELVGRAVELGMRTGLRPRNEDFRLSRSGNDIMVTHRLGAACAIDIQSLKAAYRYYDRSVPSENRFESLLRYEPATLSVE